MYRQSLLLLCLFGFMLYFEQCSPYCLQTPTYMSEWKVIKSQADDLSELLFEHGLGEIPIKVVTEVKVTNSGKDYIFHATGSAHEDDDGTNIFGGIVYMYNDVEVRVFAPKKSNSNSNGLAMYTGSSTSWTGPFNERFSMAFVRVKAWKRDDLPEPDYESSLIHLDVQNESLVQQEFDHGLSDYPSMVVIQVRGLEDYISEAEGMSTVLTGGIYGDFGGVLYGYSNSTIRIWIPGFPASYSYVLAGIVSVNDGWGHNLVNAAYKGSCKIYAWIFHPVPAYTFMESGDIDTSHKYDFTIPVEPAHALIIAEVQPNDGVNSGFRFTAAASAMNDGVGQPYGGLFYGYNSQGFVMWKPIVNYINRDGTIFNIGHVWGGGKYSQSTNDVTIRLQVWNLFPEDQVRCWQKANANRKNYQLNIGAYYSQTAEFDCLPYYKYINGSRNRTCQRNCTWSGSDLKCQAPQATVGEEESTSKLRVSLKETSKYKRSLTSAQDNRTSAKVLGAVSTSVFSIPAILIIGSEVAYVLISFLYIAIRAFNRKR